MKRNALKQLNEWKTRPNRKPLILEGARQVGKTWLMKEFGRASYKNIAYVNFEANPRMQELFSAGFDVAKILEGISIEAKQRITPGETLVLLDEIQECPQALTSLKYLQENAAEQHIIAAGSLLGVFMRTGGVSFPVGKVDFMRLYPFSFSEFLSALGKDDLLELLKKRDWHMIGTFKDALIDLLKRYYFIGGMPEAVASYAKNGDLNEVRRLQEDILRAYEADFSKHVPSATIPKILRIWNSLPTQLSKENKKFMYSEVSPKARSKDYCDALAWLSSAGLVYEVSKISKPGMPLDAYVDDGAFKLYALDVGLLSAMSGLTAGALLEGSRIFSEFKGALTEQYVLQEIRTTGLKHIHYWTSGAKAEVDFVIQNPTNGEIIPIEVKSALNLKAKSLARYIENYSPQQAYRISLSNFCQGATIIDYPLYSLFAEICME